MRMLAAVKSCLSLLLAGTLFGAAAEDRVVVLTSYPQEAISLFESAFEKANPGTRLEIVWRMPRDAMPYLLEPGSHGVDVYWSASTRNYSELAKRGLLAPLAADPALPEGIGAFPISDASLRYRASEVASYGFACNRAKLEARGVSCPTLWSDLAKSDYADRVLLPVPSKVGFAPLMYEILLQRLGWDAGWALITQIGANSALFVPGGAFITDRVSLGEQDVGVTIDFFARSAEANGAPLTFTYPDVIGFSPAHVAILASAPHPEGARKYVDFLLSEEGQRILTHPDIRKLPVRPSSYASLDAGYFNPFLAAERQAVDYDLAAAQNRQALVNAVFDVLITDRHDALRDLWQSIHRAETVARERDDSKLAAAAAKAREAALWLPVSAAQSADPSVQRGFADHAQDWAREVDAHRATAANELHTLLARSRVRTPEIASALQ